MGDLHPAIGDFRSPSGHGESRWRVGGDVVEHKLVPLQGSAESGKTRVIRENDQDGSRPGAGHRIETEVREILREARADQQEKQDGCEQCVPFHRWRHGNVDAQ